MEEGLPAGQHQARIQVLERIAKRTSQKILRRFRERLGRFEGNPRFSSAHARVRRASMRHHPSVPPTSARYSLLQSGTFTDTVVTLRTNTVMVTGNWSEPKRYVVCPYFVKLQLH